MRLLNTLTTYPPAIGGAQLHQHMLNQQLLQHHQVQVVTHWQQNRSDWLLGTTINAPRTSEDYLIDGVSVHQLGLSWSAKLSLAPYVPIYYPLMGVALPQIATCLAKQLYGFAKNADLIHNVRIGREGISYASLQVARQLNIPFIFTPVHHPRWVGWRYHAYIKLYQWADAVIALTQAEKQILISLGVAADRIFVTGHGPILASSADSTTFRQTYQLNNDPVVLFLGQHYAYKGYRQLLAAASLVWQKIPETQFVFIGPPVGSSERDYQKICDRRIHRLGAVSLQEKTDALAACDLLCVPSTQESFGGVYTEAWSFGKPVIGCDIPAVAEVVSNEVDGYLVQQDSHQIAEAICQLLLNSTQAKKMGMLGKKKVQSHYTWQQLAQKTEKVYQTLLS